MFEDIVRHASILASAETLKENNPEVNFTKLILQIQENLIRKYLILNKNLLFEKLHFKKKKIHILFLFGSTRSPDEKILKDILGSRSHQVTTMHRALARLHLALVFLLAALLASKVRRAPDARRPPRWCFFREG